MRVPLSITASVALLGVLAACAEQSLTSPLPVGSSSARSRVTVVAPGEEMGWSLMAIGKPVVSEAIFAGLMKAGRSKVSVPESDGRGIRLSAGSGPLCAALVRTTRFAGTPLSELTALAFSTYVSPAEARMQLPLLTIGIDLDGNGTVDDHLLSRPSN
jgi:hypothetical protein